MQYRDRGVVQRVVGGIGAWLLCLVIAGCGGGGGGGGSAPSAQGFVVSGGGACIRGRNACSDDSFRFNYGTGGGDGGAGAGAGGGEPAMRNVTVTAYKPDGSELGHRGA